MQSCFYYLWQDWWQRLWFMLHWSSNNVIKQNDIIDRSIMGKILTFELAKHMKSYNLTCYRAWDVFWRTSAEIECWTVVKYVGFCCMSRLLTVRNTNMCSEHTHTEEAVIPGVGPVWTNQRYHREGSCDSVVLCQRGSVLTWNHNWDSDAHQLLLHDHGSAAAFCRSVWPVPGLDHTSCQIANLALVPTATTSPVCPESCRPQTSWFVCFHKKILQSTEVLT